MSGEVERPAPFGRLTPERALWILGVPFALAFAAISPPFDPPDEVRHMARAYLISEGRLSAVGSAPGYEATIPRQILELHPLHGVWSADHDPRRWLGSLGEPLDTDRTVPMKLMTVYSPLPYLPQALAVGLGRALGGSAPLLLYLGRLADALSFLGLAWLAVRITPIRKWALVLVCVTPMSLYQAGSLSGDPATLAAACLLFAWVMRLAFPTEDNAPRAATSSVAILVALCGVLGLVKPGYWMLASLALLIPSPRFGSALRRWLAMGMCAAAVTFPSALWMLWVQAAEPLSLGAQADPTGQLAWMASHPIAFLDVLVHTLWRQWIPFVAGFTGLLGHLDIALPLAVYALYPAVLCWAILGDAPDPPALDASRRGALVGLFAGSVLLLLTFAYVGWNEVASPVVLGVQGRYFAPLAPVLALALPAGLRRVPRARPGWIVAFCAGTACIAVVNVATYYYFP